MEKKIKTIEIDKDWMVRGVRESDATHFYQYHFISIPMGYYRHAAIVEVDTLAIYNPTCGSRDTARIVYLDEMGSMGQEYCLKGVEVKFCDIAEDLNKQSEEAHHYALDEARERNLTRRDYVGE